MRGYVFALSSVLLVTLGQLLMKWGVSHFPVSHSLAESLTSLPVIFIVAGLVAYALSMGCWMLALAHLPLSRAYPMLSLSYVFVYCLAVVLPWYSDTWSAIRILGVGLVAFGVFLVNGRPLGDASRRNG